MPEKILLSICIPTRNRADRLQKLVSDCLKINSDRVEIVVGDDCSNDNTETLMRGIRDKRFLYYRNPKSIGYPNMAHCIAAGNGKFCMLMRDKDTIPNIDKWFNQVENILEKSSTTVFRGDLIDTEGAVRALAKRGGGLKRYS